MREERGCDTMMNCESDIVSEIWSVDEERLKLSLDVSIRLGWELHAYSAKERRHVGGGERRSESERFCDGEHGVVGVDGDCHAELGGR